MTMRTHGSPLVSFSAEGDHLRVRDELERQDLELRLDEPVTPEPALTDLFHFPVDRAVSCTTTSLQVGEVGGVFLRDRDGDRISDFSEPSPTFPEGTYYLDITGPVRTYVRIAGAAVDASYEPVADRQPLTLTFDREARVAVGARSLHSRPEATITVPDDPEAMMEAFAYLGSSIKEFSPERSWPTLRGHPPALERGDELRIPEHLSKPDTGFTVTVPPNYADLYRVAPLAFYFGATVEPGDPALHFPNDYVERLQTPDRSLEESVDWLLARCLLLDALVRDAGYSPLPLQEYEDLSPHLPFYPHSLYEESMATQVMEYLEVSEATLRDAIPRWETTAVLRPDPEDVALLPSLLDDFARVHVAADPADYDQQATTAPSPSPTCVTGFTHDDTPAGSAHLRKSAFEQALGHESPSVPSFRPFVVTETTAAADRVRELVERGDDRFDAVPVAVCASPTRDELAGILSAGADLIICGLPTVAGGIECADGVLDPATLDTVDAHGFVLGGVAGRDHAQEFVDHGAVSGLVTADPLTPRRTVRLLRGPLGGHNLVDSAAFVLDDPRWFVGHASRQVVHREGGDPPLRYELRSVGLDEHELFAQPSPSDLYSLGSVTSILAAYAREGFTLAGTRARQPVPVDTETAAEILRDEDALVVLNGDPYHGEAEPTAEFVRESARRALSDDGLVDATN